MDQQVDARGWDGVATNQQGMKRQYLPQAVVLDELGDETVDPAAALRAVQIWDQTDHIAEPEKRLVSEFREPIGQYWLGLPHEPTVPGSVGQSRPNRRAAEAIRSLPPV